MKKTTKIVLAETVKKLKGKNPYEILGFTPSFVGILKRNRNLLKRLVDLHRAYLLAVIHPDVVKDEDKKTAEELAKIINEAANRINDEFESQELIEQYILSRDLEIKALKEDITNLSEENRRLQRENQRLNDEIRKKRENQIKLVDLILSFIPRSELSKINQKIPCLLIVNRGKFRAIYFIDENRKIYEIVGKSRLVKARLEFHLQQTLEMLTNYKKSGKIRLKGVLLGSSKDEYSVSLNNLSFRNYDEIMDFLVKIEANLENKNLIAINYVGFNERTQRYYIVFEVIKIERIIKIKEGYIPV
jgi:hypothetical protein